MPTLEERILRLEEIEAIRRLKNVYAAHCDNNYDPEALAPMFTEDAVWEMGPLGRFEGRQQIKDFFTEVSGKFTFALHYMCGHMIDFVSSYRSHRHVVHLGDRHDRRGSHVRRRHL